MGRNRPPESAIEQLILRILYFRGELYGQDLSIASGLKFSVIHDVVEALKLSHHIQVKRSMGMGNVGSVFALTETGRERTRQYLESNQYYGPAPVPIAQYAELVRQQRQADGWLTKEGLGKAFRGMVLTESILSQIGPAISSANSLLLYGKPGDGKTFLIESLANLDTNPIFVPYALECQGNIIQVFDPIYHIPILEPESEPSLSVYGEEATFDRRWVKCKRPLIVSGGELSLEMLDLRFNHVSKIYEAPFQLKANNGIYLIDDFGRQRVTPAEVLNRWIVPMERRLDYLSFLTGGKMTVPFEIFLVFSTNLDPAALGDEAFLRRIQYKMLLRSPRDNEFVKIFEDFCIKRQLPCPSGLLKQFIEKHYKATGKQFRRCHPRDLLTHALDLIHFEKLPFVLTEEVLDRAFNGCFLEEHPDDEAPESSLVQAPSRTCEEYWSERLAQLDTSFGRLALVAGLRDKETTQYRDVGSEMEFGDVETTRYLDEIQRREFAQWRLLAREAQTQEVQRYLQTTGQKPDGLVAELKDWVAALMPAGSNFKDTCLFRHDLAMVLDTLSPPKIREPEPAESADAGSPVEVG